MCRASNSFDILLPLPEDADFVHNARLSQLHYSQTAINKIWVAHGAKIVAVGVGYDARLVALVDLVSTFVDHVLVHDRVDKNTVDWVVHMSEDIVVVPMSV